ncbi:NYN domain-containing protein [Candidatus Hydrogenedentota bacterium]
MPDTLIIDGYNVIHHDDGMKSVLNNYGPEEARSALISVLCKLPLSRDDRIIVVFDGKSGVGDGPTEKAPKGIKIVFSKGSDTADTVIERMIYQQKSNKCTTVVSRDNHLRDLCIGLGAGVMSPDNFLSEISVNRKANTQGSRHANARGPLRAPLEEMIGKWSANEDDES